MDFKKLFRKDEKAVSPVIGVILMVAITVILAAAIGSSVFSKGTAEAAPQASLNIKPGDITDDTDSPATVASVKIEHNGGDPINFEKSSVTKVMASKNGADAVEIKADGTETSAILGTMDVGDIKTLPLTAVTASEQFPVAKGDTIGIKIIDVGTNQLICDKNVRFI